MSDIIFLPTGPLRIEGDSKEVSDGNHTFGELYEHRIILFLALMTGHPQISWRARKHEDGTCYEGSFLAGIDLPSGTVTYHIPDEYWRLLDDKGIETLEFAKHWDGHTSFDVIDRITDYVAGN